MHVVCDHLELLFEAADEPVEALTAVSALVSSVLFDAALVLDAYEMSVTEQIVRDLRPEPASSAPERVAHSPGSADPAPRPRPIARVLSVDRDEALARRRFVGLDDTVAARLRDLAPFADAVMPRVLDRF
ncbi:MAG: hypothetical protein U0Q03_20380 [Acidimicrobiales bacterium]